MSAADFIILRIHPDHPKVLRLAELTGDDPYTACGRAVAWFRHVDQHCTDERTGLGPLAFHQKIGWRGLSKSQKRDGRIDYFDAMRDRHVGWIELAEDGTALVTEYENNFGRSSRRRYKEAQRKAAYNSEKAAQQRRTGAPISAQNRRTAADKNAPKAHPTTTTTDKDNPPAASAATPLGGSTPVASSRIAWTPGGWEGISDRHMATWAEAYPACDIKRQLAAMHAWLLANPKRSRKSNYERFITNWLGKEQDRGGDTRNARGGTDRLSRVEGDAAGYAARVERI